MNIMAPPPDRRKVIGQENRVRLTMKDARDIRRLFQEEDIPKAELARRYGCTVQNIYNIIVGKTWTESKRGKPLADDPRPSRNAKQ